MTAENIDTAEQLEANLDRLLPMTAHELDKTFKYIRFSERALRELRMERWAVEIGERIVELWAPFLKVVAYTTFCVAKGVNSNKYLKPFFSDADRPEETIIGQLNLRQIVETRDTHREATGFTRIK